ncbi:YfiT family bacillithiol transferase [Pseudoneobacillus rhizosphaerae]|uniref:Putative metal-dependent hydrolase NEOCIP111885_03708 n=1 Tax=Pseudoneobacillus rhizosphaerae TaxID=2880968 RepID=A0A9C7GD87_9BACI|nr:bacillithiol transferase BstA [Pseudoneobacillus rhizosphaerae]CAG9609965.1 Putative metal-dependent hydrolase YfiT [Pseudoneobacillus rhizosphaerae]
MDLRYPVGHFKIEGEITTELISNWIAEIENAPRLLREAVRDLQDYQLNTPYRPGGWTVRQVVHHLPDSHLNSYIRLKLALTEEKPVIKPYKEDKWAELPDSKLPVEVSLQLMEAIHSRWVSILNTLSPSELEKTFYHPESGENSIASMIALYAWHSRHHIAHITSLRNRLGW